MPTVTEGHVDIHDAALDALLEYILHFLGVRHSKQLRTVLVLEAGADCFVELLDGLTGNSADLALLTTVWIISLDDFVQIITRDCFLDGAYRR